VRAIAILNRLQHTHTWLREERQRTAGRAGHNRSVDGTRNGRPSPGNVTLLRIGSRDAPQVLAVVRKLAGEIEAEPAMHLRSQNGILKVIGVFIALVAESESCLGLLMDKERREGTDIANAGLLERDV